jgi:hypothetical protein
MIGDGAYYKHDSLIGVGSAYENIPEMHDLSYDALFLVITMATSLAEMVNMGQINFEPGDSLPYAYAGALDVWNKVYELTDGKGATIEDSAHLLMDCDPVERTEQEMEDRVQEVRHALGIII